MSPPDAVGNVRRAWAALPKRPGQLKRGLSLLASLRDLGWHDSVKGQAPVDGDGAPLPWYTYPALLWIGPRLKKTDAVFEFGGGHSTLWYASRVATVVTVEHDDGWATQLARTAPSNATVLHRPCLGDQLTAPLDDPYVAAVTERPEQFDVVVVDGVARITCVETVLPLLQPSSLMVLDNADRPAFRPTIARLTDEGFQRIDFVGPVPGSGRLGCTSVFARDLRRWTECGPTLPVVGY